MYIMTHTSAHHKKKLELWEINEEFWSYNFNCEIAGLWGKKLKIMKKILKLPSLFLYSFVE